MREFIYAWCTSMIVCCVCTSCVGLIAWLVEGDLGWLALLVAFSLLSAAIAGFAVGW